MKNKGFTMIELVVAVAIMGVLMIIAIPSINYIKNNNKNTKYITYEKSLKSAAKAYVDSYDEDLFGNINSGCAIVKYSDLKERDLINDIQLKGISCDKDEDTYIYVLKTRTGNHTYYGNIVCRQGSEVVYSNSDDSERNSCAIEDGKGPTITIINKNKITNPIDDPYNNGKAGNNAKYPDLYVKVEDENTETGAQAIGLRPEYIKLKYQWYKDGSALSGTGAKGDLNVNVKRYYTPSVKKAIPMPKDSMNKEEADARYSLKVYGWAEDMNGNKTEKTLSDAWTPTDYLAGSAGYEFEKRSKCPSYTWKQKNGSAAQTTAWYNNNRNQIKVTLTPVSSGIARFKAHHYVVQGSINNGAFSNVNTNLAASSAQTLNVPNTINGKYKYTVSYYKTAGTSGKKYTCPNSSNYQFDHDNPRIAFVKTNGTWANATSELKAYKNNKGYQTSVSFKLTCTDPTSPVTANYNGTNRKNPYTVTESAHGTRNRTATCTDAAGNYVTDTKNASVIKYAKNSNTYCGCATCKSCKKAGCKTPTYSTSRSCYISYANKGCYNGGSYSKLSYCKIKTSNTSSVCCCKTSTYQSGCSAYYTSCSKCGCKTGKSCWY